MAKSLKPWIAQYICDYDNQFGYDLSQGSNKRRVCQIIQFTTYRTPAQPQAQITAVISDATHSINATFDVNATNVYEQSKAGEAPESLTSSLRALVFIDSYRLRLVPPAPGSKNPNLELDILAWEVIGGDRHDPVYYPEAVSIGCGQTTLDNRVHQVIRKWWQGELSSQPESNSSALNHCTKHTLPQDTVLPPRTRIMTGNSKGKGREKPLLVHSNTLIRFDEFMSSVLNGEKKLPAFIIKGPSSEQQAALDSISVFGVVVSEPTGGAQGAQESSPRIASEGSRHRAPETSPKRPHESLPPPPPASSSGAPPAKSLPAPIRSRTSPPPKPQFTPSPVAVSPVKSSFPSSPSKLLSSPPQPRHRTPIDSDESDVPVRPLVTAKRGNRRDNIFTDSGPAAFRSSSQPTYETDSEDLSDHERNRRRREKAVASNLSHSQGKTSTHAQEGDSLSQSAESAPFSLEKYDNATTSQPGQSQPSSWSQTEAKAARISAKGYTKDIKPSRQTPTQPNPKKRRYSETTDLNDHSSPPKPSSSKPTNLRIKEEIVTVKQEEDIPELMQNTPPAGQRFRSSPAGASGPSQGDTPRRRQVVKFKDRHMSKTTDEWMKQALERGLNIIPKDFLSVKYVRERTEKEREVKRQIELKKAERARKEEEGQKKQEGKRK